MFGVLTHKLLLYFPSLWLSRLHHLVAYFLVAVIVCGLIGMWLPLNFNHINQHENWFLVAFVLQLVPLTWWFIMQVRDSRRIPAWRRSSSGRLLILFATCIGLLVLPAFALPLVAEYRIREEVSRETFVNDIALISLNVDFQTFPTSRANTSDLLSSAYQHSRAIEGVWDTMEIKAAFVSDYISQHQRGSQAHSIPNELVPRKLTRETLTPPSGYSYEENIEDLASILGLLILKGDYFDRSYYRSTRIWQFPHRNPVFLGVLLIGILYAAQSLYFASLGMPLNVLWTIAIWIICGVAAVMLSPLLDTDLVYRNPHLFGRPLATLAAVLGVYFVAASLARRRSVVASVVTVLLHVALPLSGNTAYLLGSIAQSYGERPEIPQEFWIGIGFYALIFWFLDRLYRRFATQPAENLA